MFEPVTTNLAELRRKWGWFIVLGIVLIVLGLVTLGHAALATLISTMLIGWLLVIGGVVQAVHAFQVRGWGGMLLDFLLAILYIVAGIIMVGAPAGSALALTLVVAAYLLIGGIYRVVSGLFAPFAGSGWLAFSGLIAALLGIALWRDWPVSGLWFLGLCVGIELIIQGAAWLGFGFTLHRAERARPTAPGAPEIPPGAPHPFGA